MVRSVQVYSNLILVTESFFNFLFSENQKVNDPLFDLQAKLLLWFSLTNSVFDYVNISLR